MFYHIGEQERILEALKEAKDLPDSFNLENEYPLNRIWEGWEAMYIQSKKVYGSDKYFPPEMWELSGLLSDSSKPSNLKRYFNRIEKLLFLAVQIKQQMDIDEMEPHTKRGLKLIGAAKAGHEFTHGTKQEKEERWKEYQEFIEKIHPQKPHLTLTDCRKLAATRFKVCLKTITRHTRKTW